MAHHVTVISSSDKKRAEAVDHLGADEYFVSSDAARMQEAAESLDYIIVTIPVVHPLEPYYLLKNDAVLILVGAISDPLQFVSPSLTLSRRSISGSLIRSMKNMEEMLEFYKDKEVTSSVEIVKMEYINTALRRLEKNNVRFRFFVDVTGSKLDY